MDNFKNISVRLEGGMGDCLLGNRFIPAIKEAYPNSEITAFIDSEGKTFQKEILDCCYPSFYKEIKIIPNKKYKDFWVDCQFGTDNYYGALENVPDKILSEMLSYDKFYDLHIDSLKWTKNKTWIKYHRFFPKPHVEPLQTPNRYIVLHLVSSTSVGHRMEEWYIVRLIKELLERGNFNIKIISTPDTNHFYQNLESKRVEIINANIKTIVSIIGGAAGMISTDSGFRYLAYGYSIPTLIFSKQSVQPFSAIPSHQIRWLIFPETCFPLHYDATRVSETLLNCIKNPAQILVPYVSDFNSQCVYRNYIINTERTK
jgi:ADP-heptose:LPS heptosyltransferase